MSSQLERPRETRETFVYEIRLDGRLDTGWSDWFAGMRVTLDDAGDTILTGPIDQSGLHGILRRVRDLGLPLISVARIEPAPGPMPDRPGPDPDTREDPIK